MDRPSVLVTGGARRIGATIARHFAGLDWHVVIHHHHSEAEAERLAADLPSAEAIACDLADPEATAAMIAALAPRLGDWRLLVNCAAVFRFDRPEAPDRAVFDEAMAINAAAPAWMMTAYFAAATSAAGRVAVNLLDMKIANPNPDFFSYTLAKNALAAAVPLFAMTVPAPGDRVYGLAPGAMLPSFDQAPVEHETSGRMNLLGRLTEARELAEAAEFLSHGHLASGETLFVDSGQHLLRQPRDVIYLARN